MEAMRRGQNDMENGTNGVESYNLNEVYEILENYDRAYDRKLSVEEDIVQFVKGALTTEQIDGIRLVKLETNMAGMPSKLVFDVIAAGRVLERYKNSEVHFGETGYLDYNLKFNSVMSRGQSAMHSRYSSDMGSNSGYNSGVINRNINRNSNRKPNRNANSNQVNNGFKVNIGDKTKAIIMGVLIVTSVASTCVAIGSTNSAMDYKAELNHTNQVLKEHGYRVNGNTLECKVSK